MSTDFRGGVLHGQDRAVRGMFFPARQSGPNSDRKSPESTLLTECLRWRRRALASVLASDTSLTPPMFAHLNPYRLGCLLLLGMVSTASGISVKLALDSVPESKVTVQLIEPEGAGGTSKIVQATTGNAPGTVAEFASGRSLRILPKQSFFLRFEAGSEYEPQTVTLTYEECRKLEKGDFVPVPKVVLARIAESIPVRLEILGDLTGRAVPGARVEGAGSDVRADSGEADLSLGFKRPADGGWSALSLRITAPECRSEALTVTREQVMTWPLDGGLRRSRVTLEQQVVGVSALVEVLEPPRRRGERPERMAGAVVEVVQQSTQVVSAHEPLRVTLNYGKSHPGVCQLRISHTNFAWRGEGGLELEAFERAIAFEEVFRPPGSIVTIWATNSMVPETFPTRVWEYRADGVESGPTNMLVASYVGVPKGEDLKPERVGALRDESEHLVLSRVSIGAEDKDKRIYFVVARVHGETPTDRTLEGTVIYRSSDNLGRDGGRYPLSNRYGDFETDPCISVDGTELFYSAVDDGVRCIMKRPARGGAGAPITRNPEYRDTQPTVDGNNRLAFTRSQAIRRSSKSSEIHLQYANPSGKLENLFRRLCEGHSPAFRRKGDTIAYIDPQSRLRIINVADDFSAPRSPLTDTVSVWPTWDPVTEKWIYFAKVSDDGPRRHFDLYRVEIDPEGGQPTPQILTRDVSLDSSPAVVTVGVETYVYFLSNRGAVFRGDDNALALHSLKIPRAE